MPIALHLCLLGVSPLYPLYKQMLSDASVAQALQVAMMSGELTLNEEC